MQSPSEWAFWVSGAPSAGAGHIYRSLALADALQDAGASCAFLLDSDSGGWAPTIRERGHGCEERAAPLEDLRAELATISLPGLVIDRREGTFRTSDALIQEAFETVVQIDDAGTGPWSCDLLVHPGLVYDQEHYRSRTAPATKVLAGAEYVLLREEFRLLREDAETRDIPSAARKILVSCGGSDTRGVAPFIVQSLNRLSGRLRLQITVIVGVASAHFERVEKLARASGHEYEILRSTDRMGRMMLEHDLFIGTCGVTAWERLCCGLPSIGIAVTDEQREVGRALSQRDCLRYLGRFGEIGRERLEGELTALVSDRTDRKAMATAGMALVDGRGASRVAHEMSRLRAGA